MPGRWYTPEFEEIWRAYSPPMNASKKMASEAYKKAKPDLPDHFLLIKCCEAYNEWLKANGRKGVEYPKAHLSTWLNQARWETFLPRAEELLKHDHEVVKARAEATNTSGSSWPVAILNKLGLAPAIIDKWFLVATFVPGNPPEIICPTRFQADWLLSRWPQQIERACGAGTIISFKEEI